MWVLVFWTAVITLIAWVAHDPAGVADMIGGLILKIVSLVKGLVTALIDLIAKITNGISKAFG
jgi:phage-related protein